MNAIEEAMDDPVGDVTPSYPCASYAGKVSSHANRDEEKTILIHETPTMPAVPVVADTAACAALSVVPSETKSRSNTLSTLLAG